MDFLMCQIAFPPELAPYTLSLTPCDSILFLLLQTANQQEHSYEIEIKANESALCSLERLINV